MKLFASAIALCMLLASQVAGAADGYPNRPVKIICVYPAGGGLDIVMRSIGQKLSAAWGRPVIVENVAGAGTTLGAAAVSKAPPDGYTIGMLTVERIVSMDCARLPSLPTWMRHRMPGSLV